MKRRLLLLTLTLLLAAASAAAQSRQTPAPSEAKPREGAASERQGFRLKGIDGKTYDNTEMRGQVLVVSFGATWCTPCTWELVAIEELKVEYTGKPVRFLWVSIEDEKVTSNNLLRHYAKQRGLTIPVLRDPTAETFYQFTNQMRVPMMVIFDREGRFSAPAHRGMPQDITLYKQMVRERVNALLAAPAEGGTEATAAGKAATN
jgi:peroxiredoxin